MKSKKVFSFLIYSFTGLVLLFSLSQVVGIISKYGKFSYGELTAYFLNDSYTGFFTFPFCLGALLVNQTQKESNLYFIMSRYKSRIVYILKRISNCSIIALKYYAIILFLSILSCISNSLFNSKTSDAFQELAKTFTTKPATISKSVFSTALQSGLAYLMVIIILVLFFLLLTQTKLNGAAIFAVFSVTIMINAFACLGFFGNIFSNANLFALLLSLQSTHHFSLEVLIGICGILLLLSLNILLICKRDLVLPKSNKNYETE